MRSPGGPAAQWKKCAIANMTRMTAIATSPPTPLSARLPRRPPQLHQLAGCDGRQVVPVLVTVVVPAPVVVPAQVVSAAEMTPVVPAAEVASTAVTVHQNLRSKGLLSPRVAPRRRWKPQGKL